MRQVVIEAAAKAIQAEFRATCEKEGLRLGYAPAAIWSRAVIRAVLPYIAQAVREATLDDKFRGDELEGAAQLIEAMR